MKRFTSILLASLMLVGVLTFNLPSGASDTTVGSAVVYVSEETGTPTGGATPDNPTNSIYAAATRVATAGGGTVVVVGTASITGNNNLGNNRAETVVRITSVYNGVDYREQGAKIHFPLKNKHIILKNTLVFENINFQVDEPASSIYCDHYPLVIGYGVNVTTEHTLNIYGGSARDLGACNNFPATSSVTVLSGKWLNVKASGKGSDDKPRNTNDAQIALGPDFKSSGAPFVAGIEKSVITGKKLLIKYNGFESEEEVDYTMTVTGKDGYIIPLNTLGKFYVLANNGYAAEIDGKIYTNGTHELSNLNASVKFVESDANEALLLEAKRPVFPSSLSGTYIQGYSDNTFKPSKNITIAEASTILVRLMGKVNESKEYTKSDLPGLKATDWFYNTICYLDAFGYFDSFDKFDANRPITRAEFVSMIIEAKRLGESTSTLEFNDVPKDYKYANAIKSAVASGLVTGYDGNVFKPEKEITRAEVVVVINRALGVAETANLFYRNKKLKFVDVPESHWAYFQIVAAAGGEEVKEEKEPEQNKEGSGEVEFEVEGKVIFLCDDGNDENDGSSPEKAVKTISKAGSLVGANGGTIVVCGPLSWNANHSFGCKTDKTLMLTSLYNGVDYRKTNNAEIIVPSWKNLVPSCTTIIDNIRFHTTGSNGSFYCDNRNVTFGKDIVCIADENSSYLNIFGGSANDLGATVNYLGREGVEKAYSTIYVYGGSWASISGKGKGAASKPVPVNGTAVVFGEDAECAGITGGVSAEHSEIYGKRLVGTVNSKLKVFPEEKVADFTFNAVGEGTVEIIEQAESYIVIKAVAKDGKKIKGLNDDGTYKFEGEPLSLAIDFTTGEAKVATTSDIDDALKVVPDDYLAELDKKTDARIAEIKATKTEVKPVGSGVAYYVSSSTGNDANDGKTPETAIKTMEAVEKLPLANGDVVYFKRGDSWRDVALRTRGGVSYSAYGEGKKPELMGSPFDGAKHGKWELTDAPNVYKYSERFSKDIGQIVFNNGEHGLYAQKIVISIKDKNNPIEAIKRTPFTSYKDLTTDLEFWHDLGLGQVENNDPNYGYLYLYSSKGNPAERFSNIEFNRRGNVVAGTSNVLIDNLRIMYGGSHGVGAGTCENLKVQNCEFWWIGGAMQNYNDDGVRFGNAVEIYGGAINYTVENCYIDEVYDAGVTHQVSHATAGDFLMKNVIYKDNIILRNVYSIEHFNRHNEGTQRCHHNVFYLNNICRYAGEGFGLTRPNKSSPAHIRSGGLIADTENFVIEGNVFDRSTYDILKFVSGGDEAAEFKNNVFIQSKGGSFGTLKGATIPYNGLIPENFAKSAKDKGGNVFYYAK